jgi:hypothetical protein
MHAFLTSPLGDEWSASRPGSFNPRKRVRTTHWVGPRADLDVMEKKKMPCPCRELNPRCPARSPLLLLLLLLIRVFVGAGIVRAVMRLATGWTNKGSEFESRQK